MRLSMNVKLKEVTVEGEHRRTMKYALGHYKGSGEESPHREPESANGANFCTRAEWDQ